MPCGEHPYQRPCPEDLSGACTTEIDAGCYCGKVEKKKEKQNADWILSDCIQLCDI
jgi:hypothetical protein